MTKMATRPVYDKNVLETNWPLVLICSIEDVGTINFTQMKIHWP